jgi:hypothetical protein
MLSIGAMGTPQGLNTAGTAPVGGGGFDWRTALAAIASIAPHLYEARRARAAQAELEAGQGEIAAAQRTADARIGDEVMAMQTSSPEPERAAAAADYTRAVRQARTQGDASMPTTTLGSAQFRADSNAGKNAAAGYGNQSASRFARMDAPIRQRERETRGVTRATGDVQREGARASSADFIARLKAANRGRVSPWATVLGNLGQQIARNYQRPDERTL